FFHPGFWGLAGHDAIITEAKARPRAFWDKILDAVVESGVTGIEPTFSPFNWRDAVQTYGSIDRFARELDQRGLSLASGFFAEPEHGASIADPAVQTKILKSAGEYAAFIKAGGGDAMVIGLPMRKSPGAEPLLFVDIRLATDLADFLNRLGA